MANYICVEVDPNGYLHIANSEPNSKTCAYVISDSTYQEVSLRPFDISITEGWAISAAIAGIWAVAVVAKIVAKFLLY